MLQEMASEQVVGMFVVMFVVNVIASAFTLIAIVLKAIAINCKDFELAKSYASISNSLMCLAGCFVFGNTVVTLFSLIKFI